LRLEVPAARCSTAVAISNVFTTVGIAVVALVEEGLGDALTDGDP
jgi:hypothetical protein